MNTEAEQTPPEGHVTHRGQDETEVIINSRPHRVQGDQVSYDEVVQLAFPGPETDPNAIFTVTYRHAATDPSAGELGRGGSVEVRNGTIFNVTRTIKS